MTKAELDIIRRLTGEVSKDQLRYVDCFVSENMAAFMPVGGACFFARTPLHSHPGYMFILHFDEQTSIEIGGRVITGRYGKLYGLPPDVPHHELETDFPPRYVAAMIERRYFEKHLSVYPGSPKKLALGEFYEPLPELLPLLKRFMIEAGEKRPGSDVVIDALCVEICHAIIRSVLGLRQEGGRLSTKIEIDKTIEFMHANLDRKISVEDMARVAHMSASHFSRTFRDETGASPMEYLGRIRLERARKLLLAGDKSVTETALECGFGSPAYFSASFFKRFGATPSDFRKILDKSAISKKNRRIAKA